MACAHNKRKVIATGKWTDIAGNEYSTDIIKCPSCGSIEIRYRNQYVMTHTPWSQRDPEQVETKHEMG